MFPFFISLLHRFSRSNHPSLKSNSFFFMISCETGTIVYSQMFESKLKEKMLIFAHKNLYVRIK